MNWFSRKSEPVVLNRNQIQLNKAAQNLDLPALRQALILGADPNGGDKIAISPLVLAGVSIQGWLTNSSEKQQQVMLALLDAGAKPAWGGRDGQNPFEIALRKGWADVICKMLEMGQDANKVDLGGATPLQVIFSISEYHHWPLLPSVECLLNAGADPSLTSRQQPVPLLLGLKNPHLSSAPDLEDVLVELARSGGVPPDQREEVLELAEERNLKTLVAVIREFE